MAPWPGPAVLGGGPGDAMAYSLGADPTQCPYRGDCRILGDTNWGTYLQAARAEPSPSDYARQSGPSEDFAETFRFSVLEPETLLEKAPMRSAWMGNFAVTQLNFGLIPEATTPPRVFVTTPSSVWSSLPPRVTPTEPTPAPTPVPIRPHPPQRR
jgi:hypothetical protein